MDDLLQSSHPLLRVALGRRHQVDVFAFAFEDDREAEVLHRAVRVLLQGLRVTAGTHRIDVVQRDCKTTKCSITASISAGGRYEPVQEGPLADFILGLLSFWFLV